MGDQDSALETRAANNTNTKARLLAAIRNGDTRVTFGKVMVLPAPTGDFFRVEVSGDQPEGFKWDESAGLSYWEGALVDDAVKKIDAALAGKPVKGAPVKKITIQAEGISSVTDLIGITKPVEVTENYIRIRARDPGDFEEGTFRTVDLSEEKGIKTVMGRLKGEKTMTIQTYLFDKDKWTKERAQKWVKGQKEGDAKTPGKIEERDGVVVLLATDGETVLGKHTYGKDGEYGTRDAAVGAAQSMKKRLVAELAGAVKEEKKEMPRDGAVIIQDDEGQVVAEHTFGYDGEYKAVDGALAAARSHVEKALLPIADKGGGWDADAAKSRVSKWASGDKDKMNWSKYGRAFFYSSGEDNFGAFKLPFADVKDGTLKAVPEGIYTAAQAVQGAHTPMKIPLEGPRKQIAAYYEKMDEEAPWKRESKALTFSEEEDRVRNAFHKKFGPDDVLPVQDFRVQKVYPDHLIVRFKGKLYKFPFVKTAAGKIDFPFGEWEEVAMAYLPVKAVGELKEPTMRMAVAVAKAMLKRQKSVAHVWKEGEDRYYMALISMAIFDAEDQIVEKEGMDCSIALAQKYNYKSGMYIRHVVPRSLVARSMYERRIGPYWVEVGKFIKRELADWAYRILEKDTESKWKLSIGFITTKDQAARGRYTRLLKYDTTITDRPALPVTAILAVGGKTEMNDIAKLLTFLNPQSEEEKEKATAMLGDLFELEEKELTAVIKEVEQLQALRKALDEAGIEDENVRAKIIAAVDEEEPVVAPEPEPALDLSQQIQDAVTAAMTEVADRLAALEERPGAVDAVKEIGDLLRRRSQDLPRPSDTAPVVEGVTDLVAKIDKHIGERPGPKHPLAGFSGGPGPSEGG